MSLDSHVTALGPVCAFFSSLTWAIGSTGYSRLSRSHSAFAVNFARALMALPLFIVAVFISTGGIAQGVAAFEGVGITHLGWFTLSMLASYGLGDVLFLWSTQALGVPAALAIASCYPLWNLIAGCFQGRVPSLEQVVGLMLAVGGIVLVIISNPAGLGSSQLRGKQGSPVKGLLLGLATSLSWWVNGFALSRVGAELNVAVGSTVRMVVALLLSFLLSRIFEPESRLVMPAKDLQRSFWLFVVEAFGGSYLFLYGMSHSPLAIGSALSALAPVISVPIAWLIGSEKFSLFRTFGVLMSVAGIGLLLRGF
jgi:drug/metabolite transporter (DMT)-like permease